MADAVKGLMVQIGAETSGLEAALKKVGRASNDINKELKQVEKGLKFDPSNTTLLAQKQELLKDKITQTRTSLEGLRDAQARVEAMYKAGEIDKGQYRAFQREVVTAESKLKTFEAQVKDVERAQDNAGKSANNWSSKIKSGLRSAALGAGIAVASLGAFLYKCSQAAKEDTISAGKLALVFKNVTGATDAQVAALERYITKVQFATGVDDLKLRPALQNLVVSFGNVAEAQSAMSIVMDTATAKGLDLEAVSKAVARAHDGNVGALSRLGIQTKDAEGKTMSFDQIMQNLGLTFAGATAEVAKLDPWARMGQVWDEMQVSIGTALLPYLDRFANWFADNSGSLIEGAGKIASAFGQIIAFVADAWAKTEGFFAWLAGNTQSSAGGETQAYKNASTAQRAAATLSNPKATARDKYYAQKTVDAYKAYGYKPVVDPQKTVQPSGPQTTPAGRLGYALGGIVPGSGPIDVIAHGGEPILPRDNPMRALQLIAQSGVLNGLRGSSISTDSSRHTTIQNLTIDASRPVHPDFAPLLSSIEAAVRMG